MSLKALLVSMLVLSLVAFGQTGAGNQPSNPPQTGTYTNLAQPIPAGNGLSWSGGTIGYYGEGVVGPPLLTTPTATFDAPQPTAGISDSGRAGISNASPVSPAVQSTLNSATMVYTNFVPESSVPINPATAAVTQERAVNDMGPSYFSDKIGATSNNGASLGEIAARYQNMQGHQSVRTYTNADVRPPATLANTENVVLAANRPPTLPQTQTAPGGNAPAGQSNAQNSSQVASSQSAASSEPAQSQSSNERLPASSTILPLLGLMGLVSTGLGLIFMKSGRKVVRS